jgi:hypothetical protein
MPEKEKRGQVLSVVAVSGNTLDLLKGRLVGRQEDRPHLFDPERAGVALEEIEVIPGWVDLEGFVRRVEILIIGAKAGNKGFALAGFDTYRLRSCRMAWGQQKVDPVSKGGISADGLDRSTTAREIRAVGWCLIAKVRDRFDGYRNR